MNAPVRLSPFHPINCFFPLVYSFSSNPPPVSKVALPPSGSPPRLKLHIPSDAYKMWAVSRLPCFIVPSPEARLGLFSSVFPSYKATLPISRASKLV